ncbi:YdcF family protein [Georgenia sp. Z1491]|uniref:YdcF family protein n=1 Tax=Georgenia sp. Z1491 TaxID=3416707 RepID=UPI003CFB187E
MDTTWILVVVALLGLSATAAGVVGIVRDGRRISTLVRAVLGLGTAVLAVALLLYSWGHEGMLLTVGIAALVVVVLGNVLGYPLLVLFLLWSGVTVLRRESRTLGNALALVAGVGLVLLPGTLGLLEPSGTAQPDAGYMVRYAVHLALVLIVAELAFSFAAFLGASVLYRWRRTRVVPEAVIVLGSGLRDGEVPPLLSGRLERGLRAQQEHDGRPVIITSGGQGPDEPRSEGVAMREYLLERGTEPDRVVAETESRNTSENLRFSRRLLTAADAPVEVVTSSYHVFRAALLTRDLGMRARVLGSRTAWYYVASAMLREFAALTRDHLRLHATVVVLLVALAVALTLVVVPASGTPTGSP